MTVEYITVCWVCGYKCDRATNFEDKSLVPSNDDVSLCIKCGHWGIFDDKVTGRLREPTLDEYIYIKQEPAMQRVLVAWEKIEARRTAEDARSRYNKR